MRTYARKYRVAGISRFRGFNRAMRVLSTKHARLGVILGRTTFTTENIMSGRVTK